MIYSRSFIGFLLVVIVFSVCASAFSQPVLIKLHLKESIDWQNAQSLGVTAFHRFEGFVLAEVEKSKLGELTAAGLTYQVVDEHPWSQDYFLVSSARTLSKVSPGAYGDVLLKGESWQLIKGSGERAARLREVGFDVTPVHHRAIPLEYKAPVKIADLAGKYAVNIESLVNSVSEDSLYNWVKRLQDFQTRYSYSDSIIAARDWLYQKMASFGIDSLWLQHFHWDSDQWNVVATVEGTVMPERVIVIGGHYDTAVYGGGTDPMIWAPGADDDATGTVAALEMARIISQNPLPVTVMFVPFAQEEQGLVGSYVLAQYLHEQGTDLEFMFNCDMIAHNPDSISGVVLLGDPGLVPYVDFVTDMAETYTNLEPHYLGQSQYSDHYSFYQWGYDALMAYEVVTTEGLHNNYDVVESLNFEYMREVVKMFLAAIITMGYSPSPVEDLLILDAGDGDKIYLSWSANPPVENVDHYNVYFGTTSGVYDSIRQVSGTSDTLSNLTEDVTYYIMVTSVNQDGFESILNRENSMAPMVIPRAPSGLVANPFGMYKIMLDWAANREADIDFYRIYRSEESGAGYLLLADACSETTFVDSTIQEDKLFYYYTVTAVDTGGNESVMSAEAEGFSITLSQGLLVVDETYEASLAFNMVIGDSINAFYQRALAGYSFDYIDHSCPYECLLKNQLHLWELARYSSVIIHSEDQRGFQSLGNERDSTYQVLKRYLDYGGKVIIEGRRNLSWGDDGDRFIREFSLGTVHYDLLQVKSAFVPSWGPLEGYRTEEFIGAHSQVTGYPDLEVDSLRVALSSGGLDLAGRVPGVGYIDSLMAGEVLYTFHSDYDTSASEGKAVAFRNIDGSKKSIYFDFPLYFIREDQAIELLHKALSDLGETASSIAEEEGGVIHSFYLKQNFPNPFNAETIIEYSLPAENQVKLVVYNLLGQKVRTLLDERQTVGRKRVIWDGRNDRGETVASGIYFCRIEAGELSQTKKMLLLK